MALIDKLTAIADAIRGKTGKTEEMTLDQMATEIEGIETGGSSGTETIEFFIGGVDSTNPQTIKERSDRAVTALIPLIDSYVQIVLYAENIYIKAFSVTPGLKYVNYGSATDNVGNLGSNIIEGEWPITAAYAKILFKKSDNSAFTVDDLEGVYLKINETKYRLTQQISDAQALSIILEGDQA